MQSYGDARGSNGRLEDLKVDNFDTQVQDASDKAFELSQRASGFLRREKIRARLGEAVYNKGCPQAEQFIIPQDLHEIWRPQILRNFLGVLGYSGEENLVQTVLDHLIKTISILVYIRWEEWSRFESIFFPNGWGKPVREDRTDARIPYPDIILEEDQFLGSGDAAASDFFNHQNVYIPKIIEQGKRILIPKTTPLPFIKKQQEKIAVGGYGVVTKEVIAKHHFRPKSKFGSDPIKREFAVACKKFQTRGDFRAEAKNLDNLASALSKHERLVKHIAFITIGDVHDPGATKEFNILLPMADTDLKRLLYLEQYSPQCSDVVELVKEASKVFDALAWLHQGQMVEDKMQVFCHMDLKPANILVYEIGEYKFPAGCWMISDFGISSMTERHQNTQFLNTFEKSPAGTLASILGADSVLTSRKREPGIYSAPEAHKLNGKIGPASDVWSLGCILFQVLLRGVGGSEGIADLVKYDEKRRSKEHDHFCQHTDGEAHLHPAIERWLESTHLPGHIAIQDQKMIMECKNVIKQALIVDPDKRATAANLRDRLLLICEREEISNESVAGSPITSKPPFPMETSSAMPLPDRTTTNFQPTQPNPLEETKDLRLQQPESSAQPSQVAAAAFTLPPKSFSPAPTAAPPTPPDDHHIAHDLDTTDKLKHDTTGNNPSTQPENDIPRKQAKLQPLIPDRVSSHTRETALPVSKESTPAVIEPPPTFPRESVRSVDIGPFETRHRSSYPTSNSTVQAKPADLEQGRSVSVSRGRPSSAQNLTIPPSASPVEELQLVQSTGTLPGKSSNGQMKDSASKKPRKLSPLGLAMMRFTGATEKNRSLSLPSLNTSASQEDKNMAFQTQEPSFTPHHRPTNKSTLSDSLVLSSQNSRPYVPPYAESLNSSQDAANDDKDASYDRDTSLCGPNVPSTFPVQGEDGRASTSAERTSQPEQAPLPVTNWTQISNKQQSARSRSYNRDPSRRGLSVPSVEDKDGQASTSSEATSGPQQKPLDMTHWHELHITQQLARSRSGHSVPSVHVGETNPHNFLNISRSTRMTLVSSTAAMIAFVAPSRVDIATLYEPNCQSYIAAPSDVAWETGRLAGNYLAVRGYCRPSKDWILHLYQLKLSASSEPPYIQPVLNYFKKEHGRLPPYEKFDVSRDGQLLLGGLGKIYLANKLHEEPFELEPNLEDKFNLQRVWFSTSGTIAFAWSSGPKNRHRVNWWQVNDIQRYGRLKYQDSDGTVTASTIKVIHFPKKPLCLLWQDHHIHLLQDPEKPPAFQIPPLPLANLQAVVVTPDEHHVVFIRSSNTTIFRKPVSKICFCRIKKIGDFFYLDDWSNPESLTHHIKQHEKCDVVIEEYEGSKNTIKVLIAQCDGTFEVSKINLQS